MEILALVQQKLQEHNIDSIRIKQVIDIITEYKNNNGNIDNTNNLVCVVYIAINKFIEGDKNQHYPFNIILTWFDMTNTDRSYYDRNIISIKHKLTKFKMISPCSWERDFENTKLKNRVVKQHYTNISYTKYQSLRSLFVNEFPKIKILLNYAKVSVDHDTEEIIKKRFFDIENSENSFKHVLLLKILTYYVVAHVKGNCLLRYDHLASGKELTQFKQYLFKYIPMIKEKYKDDEFLRFDDRLKLLMNKFEELSEANKHKAQLLYKECSKKFSCNSLPFAGAIIYLILTHNGKKYKQTFVARNIGINNRDISRAKRKIEMELPQYNMIIDSL